jgi:hypothetical protein
LLICAKDLFVEAISVVIEPGPSLVHARMKASLANLDQGEFTEGHGLGSQAASAEGNDWTEVVAGRSQEIVGNVRMNPKADRQGSER